MNLILVAGAYWETRNVNPETAGQLGDFVGGYVGTLFGLFSIVLLYRTLRLQRENARLQSFEARYFELLKMHRDNVAEMQLQKSQGRRVFLPILRELWAILVVTREVANIRKLAFSQKQLLHISYYCLFFGTGPGSSRMLKISLPEYDADFIDDLDSKLQSQDVREDVAREMDLAYTPFEGHQSRLGHYYRHLFQLVHYVHDQEIEIDRYHYVKTIRAQLSTHEQVLLLINSLTPLGHKWWQDKLIQEYKLVKNIPRHFLNPTTHLDLRPLFDRGYFEWEENSSAA